MKIYSILIISILFTFITSSCDDSPIEPYFPPIEGEEEDDDDNGDDDENIYEDYIWISKIRDDHPRLFINNDTFDEIKARALNEESALFETVKLRVDNLIGKEIVFENLFAPDGTNYSDAHVGYRAAEAAFVFLVTEDNKYLDLSKYLLSKSIEYYHIRNTNSLNISWFSYSRVNAIMAFDWIYNYLSEEERTSIGNSLFTELRFMLPDYPRDEFPHEYRDGGITYSNESMQWYLGLAFHKTGINDEKALEYIKKGYANLEKGLAERRIASGDDGGITSGTLAYSLVDFPWGIYHYFEAFNSATGYNIATQFDFLVNNINYVYWNRLPQNRHFGFGDDRHEDNKMDYPILNYHLSRFLHFYGDKYPEHASMTKWVLDNYFTRPRTDPQMYPLSRFFINSDNSSIPARDPAANLPTARFFESMGQIFMRSGSGDNDTYATFTVSPKPGFMNHKHFDNNNFMIYKKGFLTIDSGTRPDGNHLSHYYGRTVAHNTVTIRMPGEVIPKYWGAKAPHEAVEPMPNDGGQNNVLGTNVVAFDETKDYVYIASDATGSYTSAKTNLVLRQFVFLPPNNFVIFDRVNASQASYPKKWLLHTAHRPEIISANEFYNVHEEGSLICKTIFPEDAQSELIGGPGKQFWSDGKNWPLPYGGDNWPLYGQWRMEISPGSENINDEFLHLIQVGDASANIKSIPSAEKINEEGVKGVRFNYDNKTYEVKFNTTGGAGGKISITSNGTAIVDESFTTGIKSQSGISN